MGLVVFEYMAKTGKSIEELISEIYELVGEFKYWRDDLHISEELKKEIINNCKSGNYTKFGDYKVESTDTTDGYKYFFNENEWLMIRPSGTEPVLRCYAESKTVELAKVILANCKKEIGI